jgi:hypothetical protein
MQVAERSSVIKLIALCAVSALAIAVVSRVMHERRWHYHGHHHHHGQIAFDQPGCREWIPPPVPHVDPMPPSPSPSYDEVLAAAEPQLAHCFTHGARATELLVTIAPDGRVRTTTSRPEPATQASRCLGNVVATLVFPPSRTTVMMRVPLAPRR